MIYQVKVKWNREFHYSDYWNHIFSSIDKAKKFGESLLMSGDGARIKSFIVVDEESRIVYPKSTSDDSDFKHLYYCDYCDKQEYGKPISWLKSPNKNSDTKVALRPNGWQWDQDTNFGRYIDYWSCGCFNLRNKK